MRFFIFGTIFSLLFLSTTALAQVPLLDPLSSSVNPKHPQPGELVTVTVESYVADISGANFLWYLDGVLRKEGRDVKSYSFTAGPNGTVHNIDVRVDKTNGQSGLMAKSILIGTVDLVWQADSKTPPFYKGKALLGYQNTFQVVAIPSAGSVSNLEFRWKYNGTFDPNQSGRGKNVFNFNRSTIRTSHGIEVEVVYDGNNVLGRTINLSEISPKVLFYKKEPLLGVLYNQALVGEYFLKGNDLILKAEPFFLSKDNNSNYKWSLNGTALENIGGELPLYREVGVSGLARIRVLLENTTKSLQTTRAETLIKY